MPRCWPAAYGSLPLRNPSRTEPDAGQVQALAPGSESEEGELRRRLFAVEATCDTSVEAGSPPLSNLVTVLSQRPPVERVPARPGQPGDQVGRLSSRHAGDDELVEGRERPPRRSRPATASARPEHERDLPFRRLRKRAATVDAGPRTTSSNCLVSSRQTATCRSGWASASERRLRRAGAEATRRPPPARASRAARPTAPPRAASPAREVAEKLVALGREAAGDERGLDRRGARQDGDRHSRLERGRDQPGAGVADAGQAGIGDERDARTLPRASGAPRRCGRPRCARGS